MNRVSDFRRRQLELGTRRQFLASGAINLGALWLAQQVLGANSTIARSLNARPDVPVPEAGKDGTGPLRARAVAEEPMFGPHFAPRAKRVIYMHMAGAPSQLELFEHKPELNQRDGQACPAELLAGQRFAFIRGVPTLLGSVFPFRQAGESGAWLSDRLVHFEKVVDRICFLRAMQTDQFNHAPAQLLVLTGNQNLGYASAGSWVTYGLGSETMDLPGYVVLLSGGRFPDAGKSGWSAGFLPSVYQGVQCRSAGPPVLFLANPAGVDAAVRRKMIDAIREVNEATYREVGDPETVTRIAQYELAYRMQMSAGDAMDIRRETAEVLEMYGAKPGEESLANNCLLARRLIERGVRYVQLFDWGWDAHGAGQNEALNFGFKDKCLQMDRAVSALLIDLVQRGLLDDTLVVWGGEFGRTPMRENRGGKPMEFAGRDHHPHAFTIWLAGGGVKSGFSYGETDPLGYAPVRNAVNPRDLHATMLYLLGIDHRRLTFRYQGLDQKLTGVKPARVISEIVA
jgi:hypothetical protein